MPHLSVSHKREENHKGDIRIHLIQQNARHEAHSRDENEETETETEIETQERTLGEEETKINGKKKKTKELSNHTLYHKYNIVVQEKGTKKKRWKRNKTRRKETLGWVTLGTHEKEEKNLGSSSKSSALTGTYHSFFGQRLWLRLYGGCGMPNDRSFEW